VLPGNALERLRVGDRVVALAVVRSGGGHEADRRSAWREWVREKTWSELERLLGVPDLAQLKITRRSGSGRVVGLTAVSRRGSNKEWNGFDVRRALQLPETLFSMHVRTRADGVRVGRVLGRGWGHGVGLCQNGAYGLARAGRGFQDILHHYYTGIQLRRWAGSEASP
jgi:stage II sporulation protein D